MAVKDTNNLYQVLARKWRPQRFADVVGQEHISRTLQNAILQGRVGHAYLFVGPRGIGKTTTARIFAKALNCDRGVVVEPCCECQSCREIAGGTSLDVIEIDGASHNKVEDIRDIRDNVQYTPSRSRYKIYIIDEVHMLSSAAWNALLKTLEEPPPHVKFLFATTEPHKVLATIVSRCQRFDLRRLPLPLIVRRLTEIAAAEQVQIEERALVAIARAAEGGMRDAQSIFDQMISFCGGRTAGVIREADVIDVFGLASGRELQELVAGLLSNDVSRVMTLVQGLADRGRDLERLFVDTVGYLRNVMILQLCRNAAELLEVSQAELADLRQTVSAASASSVQQLLDSLLQSENGLRNAANKRVFIEVILVRAMRDAHSVPIDEVLTRLHELRRGEGTLPRVPPAGAAAAPPLTPPVPAAPAPPTPPAATPPAATPPAAAPETAVGAKPPSHPPPPPPQAVAAGLAPATGAAAPPPVVLPEAPPTGVAGTSPPPVSGPLPAVPGAPVPAATVPTSAAAPTTAASPGAVAAVAAPPPVRAAQALGLDAAQASPAGPPSPLPAVVAAPGPGTPAAGVPRLVPESEPELALVDQPDEIEAAAEEDEVQALPVSLEPAELWHRLVGEVDRVPGRQHLRSCMQELSPISFRDGVLLVGFDADVPTEHVAELQRPDSLVIMEKCFTRVSPVPHSRVVIKRRLDDPAEGKSRLPRASPEVRARVEKNPFVQRVCQVFSGKVIEVRG